jgi:hypothetical protein
VVESRGASGPSEFALRAPEWWRDLTLGLLFGVALLWAFSDALHWENFRRHLAAEIVCVGIPFALALLSPRRLLALFLGFCIALFRCIFLIFLFHNLWSMLATLAWLLLLAWSGYAASRRYKLGEMRLPEGFTIVEFLLLGVGFGGGVFLLYLLRGSLGLD